MFLALYIFPFLSNRLSVILPLRKLQSSKIQPAEFRRPCGGLEPPPCQWSGRAVGSTTVMNGWGSGKNEKVEGWSAVSQAGGSMVWGQIKRGKKCCQVREGSENIHVCIH